MRTARLIAVLTGAALLLAVLAASPAGGAARRSIAAFAQNAGAVNGIKASRTPKPGRLVPLGKNAKLPRSVVPTTRGVRGLQGPAGPPGLPAAVPRRRSGGARRREARRRPANTPVGRSSPSAGSPSAACSARTSVSAVDPRQRPARGRDRRHRRVLPRGDDPTRGSTLRRGPDDESTWRDVYHCDELRTVVSFLGEVRSRESPAASSRGQRFRPSERVPGRVAEAAPPGPKKLVSTAQKS